MLLTLTGYYDFLEKASVRLVGDDAHIVPAERADITEICGEFDGTLGSMCSIDPYEVSEVDVRAIGPTQCEEENP